MFKMLFGESFVEILVIMTLALFSYSSMADDQNFQGQADQRREFKVKVVSSELWYQGVSSHHEATSDQDQNPKMLVPEELEISLRKLK